MAELDLFAGKRVLVFGLANNRSIAWAISQAMHKAGATLGFTYLGETLEKRVRPLAERMDAELILPCDVCDDAQIAAVFEEVGKKWDGVDVLVHAVAFAHREDLEGRYVDTSRAGFATALAVSAYSLVALTKAGLPHLAKSKGNVVAMTYYGSEKVIPSYNVMGVAKAALECSVRYLAADVGEDGVRVNAVSAGPIKTLASSGIKGFSRMLDVCAERAPLKRNVTQDDVAGAALYLASDLAAGVTGEVLHVDAGYNITGM